MYFLKDTIESLDTLAARYVRDLGRDELLHWIASCLTQYQESKRVAAFDNKLITYLSGPEVFNVMMIGHDGRPRSEKTVLVGPYISKNYSFDTLKELHSVINCTAYELWHIVRDVEKDITKLKRS